jgi:hypothetical protein
MAMLNFYGGCVSNELTDKCTHAFSLDYDSSTKQIELNHPQLKIITPDWLTDSIDKNQLLDEATYNPKYLRTNPENTEIIQNLNKPAEDATNRAEVNTNDSFVNTPTNADSPSVLKPHKISLNTSQLHKKTQSPKPFFAADDKMIETPVKEETGAEQTLKNDTMDTTENNAVQLSQVSTPTESPNNINGTPSKAKPVKRSRKQGGGSEEKKPAQSASSTSTFTLDDIFQSVIGGGDDDENPDTDNKTPISANQTNSKGGVYLNLIKQLPAQQAPPLAENLFCVFDEDSKSQDMLVVQENSHLIQFDCCLLGCVFYLKPSEAFYSAECVRDWKKVIEKFGGRYVDEYSLASASEITHVVCPNRFCDDYKKAVEEKKRLVTPYWLEDVLQEQKLRQPWLAYHYPSPFDMKDGPLKNHVRFIFFLLCSSSNEIINYNFAQS